MREWKCDKEYNNDVMAIDARFGYVDKNAIPQDQYASFETENGRGTLCKK